MGLTDVFTNAGVPAAEQDIKSPAFSLTKVQAGIGTLIAAVLGAVPAALRSDKTIIVAAIAAGVLLMLGVFALAAVDILTRQRAAEARLRFGGNSSGGSENGVVPEHFFAIPDVDDLRLQVGPGADEYKIYAAEVDGGRVCLHAMRDGESMRKCFTQPS